MIKVYHIIMEWVRSSGITRYNDPDRPRFITKSEITKLLDDYINNEDSTLYFPESPGADKTSRRVARQCSVDWIVSELKRIQICPSLVTKMLFKIIEAHYKSLVVPGTPVAIGAGHSVGATTTQMTLNSVAPWEKLLLQFEGGHGKILKIGKWIDNLLAGNKHKIVHILKNRTEYLELAKPVKIVTTDNDGNVTWEDITAVTRHLPVGDLVKITTKSGRISAATQNKSFLTWDKHLEKLVDTKGKNIKVGDLIPIANEIPEPAVVYHEVDSFILDNQFGIFVGSFYARGMLTEGGILINYNNNIIKNIIYNWCTERCISCHKSSNDCFIINFNKLFELFNNWICNKNLPQEILFGNNNFIKGFLSGYFDNLEMIISKEIYDSHIDDINYLFSRIGKYSNNITISDTFVHNNIMLDPIVKVEYIKDVEFVYDLTVPKTLNFALYNGTCYKDTFHSSGSAVSASSGIDLLRDIIYARKIPKNEGCTIHYKNKFITYEEALDTRRYIVGSVVSDFISDMDIDTPENIRGGRKWWHSANSLYDNELPASNLVMRLFLNTVEMYKHRVNIKQLADILEREILNSYPSIVVRYGPMSDGIIDVYPSDKIKDGLEKVIKNIKPEIDSLSESTYLESIVYPELKNIRVKGIRALRNLQPQAIPVWNIVVSERKVVEEDNVDNIKDGWILELSIDKMYINGIDHNNIIALCQSAGIQATLIDENLIYLIVPKDRYRTSLGEVVIEVDNIKYRSLDISELKEDFANLIEIEGVIYEKLDEDNIKVFPINVDYYTIEIEKSGKKPVGANRWIEEIIPAKNKNIPKDDIFQLEKVYYRKLPDLYTIKNNIIISIDNIIIKDGKLYDVNNDIITNLYQNLTNTGLNINELKPSEYINNKISEAKKSYQSTVTKRTNEIIEQDKKNKIYNTKTITHEIEVPIIELSVRPPINDNILIDANHFIDINDLEKKDNDLENLKTVVDYISDNNILDEQIPLTIREWLESGGEVVEIQIGTEIKSVVDEVKEEIVSNVNTKVPINVSRPDILKFSELIIAHVDIDINFLPATVDRVPIFKSLLGLHVLDKRRTTCNNMHVLAKTFGIEAARTYIIIQLQNTISSNGSYVHPAHLMFIAEFITSRGVPYGTTFTGISRQPGGHLTLATVERAGKTFTQHALHGRKEDIRNVSASISVGARMVIGNGMVSVAQDIIENGKTVTLIDEDVFRAHERDETMIEKESETKSSDEEFDIENEKALVADVEVDIKMDIDEELGTFDSHPDINIGYVEPEAPKRRIIGKISKQIKNYEPIISEGLVVLTDLVPGNINNNIPLELRNLLGI